MRNANRFFYFRYFWVVPLLTGISLSLSPIHASASDLPEALNKLRVVLIIDEQAENIGEGVKRDGEIVREVFGHIFKNPDFPKLQKKEIRLDTIGGSKKIAPEDILSYFKENHVGKDEALFIYFSGHGTYNPALNGGHILQLSGGKDLPRRTLWSWVDQETESPLRIFVSDACATIHEVTPEAVRVSKVTKPEELGKVQDFYETLFFRHRGTIDFNSSTPGQASWTFSPGSLMTLVFQSIFLGPDLEELDINKDGVVTWPEIFYAVQADTSKAFKKIRSKVKYAPEDPIPPILRAKDQVPFLFAVDDFAPNHIHSFFLRPSAENREAPGIEIFAGWEVNGYLGRKIKTEIYFVDSRDNLLNGTGDLTSELLISSDHYRVAAEKPLFVPFSAINTAAAKGPIRAGIKLIDSQNSKVLAKSLLFPIGKPPEK